MSDFLVNFIKDDKKKPKEGTGISFIDNDEPALSNEIPAGKAPKTQKGKESGKFLKTDDAIHVKFKPRGQAEENLVIPRLKKGLLTFLNKSVIFYGPSGSGKTILMKDYMYIMRKLFPIVFAFAPTNYEKHDFDKVVPIPLVFEEFGLADIKNVYQRQRAAASIYNTANDLAVLKSLFHKVADARARQFAGRMMVLREKARKQTEETYASDVAIRKAKIEEIEDMFKNKLIRFFKQVITPKVKRLNQMNLSKEERYAIEYINFNAHILVVFDDATDEILSIIKEGKKKKKGEEQGKNEETVKSFFFKGRWAYITHWYAFHDDAGLDAGIRKNAFYSIFTDKSTALTFFQRPANGFGALEKKRAEAIINAVFDEKQAPEWSKLVYSRIEKKFYYVVADPREDFQKCAKIVRQYCDKSGRKGAAVDTSNPYLSRFTDKIDNA